MADMPRPGTSLYRPRTATAENKGQQGIRPTTAGGRPLTGFARPGTGSSRPGSKSGGRMTPSVEMAFQGSRPGTSRPVTQSGRFVRLGTASMRSEPGGPFVDANKLDFKKYSQRQPLAKVLTDYILYHDHNPKCALELAALSTVVCDYKCWWWKSRLGVPLPASPALLTPAQCCGGAAASRKQDGRHFEANSRQLTAVSSAARGQTRL